MVSQAKPSRVLAIEVKMIPHVYIKNLWKSGSDNSRREKYMKSHLWKVSESSPFRSLVTTKNPAKNIYKNKCCEDQIEKSMEFSKAHAFLRRIF